MPDEGVHQAAVPPVALAPEHAQGLGDLRPGDGVGDEGDLVAPSVLPEDAVHARDELHVLADRLVQVPAGGDHVAAAEHTEGPRDDEQAVELAPRSPARDKGPQVLDDLEVRQRLLRGLDLDEASPLELAAVGDPYDAANGRDLARLYHRPRRP